MDAPINYMVYEQDVLKAKSRRQTISEKKEK